MEGAEFCSDHRGLQSAEKGRWGSSSSRSRKTRVRARPEEGPPGEEEEAEREKLRKKNESRAFRPAGSAARAAERDGPKSIPVRERRRLIVVDESDSDEEEDALVKVRQMCSSHIIDLLSRIVSGASFLPLVLVKILFVLLDVRTWVAGG